MAILDLLRKKKFEVSDGAVLVMVNEIFDDNLDISRQMLQRVWWRNLLYYCLAEGTKIPLLDGRIVHIEDLVDSGEIWVYGFDLKKLKVVPALMDCVAHTGKKPCLEISLDNGHTFTCTQDHRILTWFGYKEAQELEVGMPLIPYRNKYYKSSGGALEYNQIFQPYDAKWEQAHRMVAREIIGETIEGHVIHHVNEDKQDNRPENLSMMIRGDHSNLTLTKHREKTTRRLLEYCQSEEGRKNKSECAKRQWKEKREEMLLAVRKYREDPEYVDRVRKGVQESWDDPEKRAKHLEKLKARWEEKKAAVNCRITKIRPVGIKNVFDASVPATNNFALEAGVFVHNCGEQWLEYSPATRSFIPRYRPELGSPPVSNEIREHVRSVKAALLNRRLIPEITPNTNEQEDRDAAKLGQQVATWMDSINDGEFKEEKEKMIIWLAIAGTAFLRTFIETDLGRLIMGDGGNSRTGEVTTESILPFNFFPDRMADRARKMRYQGIQSLKPIEWVEDTFGVKVTPSDNATAMDYQRRLMTLVGQVSPWKGYGLETQSFDAFADKACIFREVEFKPNKAYPQGRYICGTSDKILLDVPRMPISVQEDGQFYWTCTDFHGNFVPGRFWSDPSVNDLISPQKSINEIDKAARDNRKTLGRNRVITPSELILKRRTEVGESFLILQYDGKSSGGLAPQIQPGTPLPNQFFQEREVQKTTIQDASGDPKNVLKGHAPSAQASGVMVDILTETARAGQAPDVERYEDKMALVYKKRLLCAQEGYTEERTIKIAGAGSQTEAKQFKGADLRKNTDIKLENDSGLATTQAGKRQVLMDLAKGGFFGNIAEAPISLRQELLKRFGLSGFTDQSNVHFERAERENSRIVAGITQGIFTVTDPVNPESQVIEDDSLFKYDDDEIHYEVHRHLILSQEFQDLPAQVQAALVVHTDVHHLRLEAQKAQEAMAQAGPTQGQPGGNGAQPPGQGPPAPPDLGTGAPPMPASAPLM